MVTDALYKRLRAWIRKPVSIWCDPHLGYVQLPGIVYRSLQHGAVHYHAET